MSATPSIAISANSSAFIGTTQTVNVTFSNTADISAANATGFAPFVVLSLDSLGDNGAGTGVSFNSATFLGAAVDATTATFDASGNYAIPKSNNGTGNPIVIHGTAGNQVVLLQLPFGSFTAGQTPADIQVKLDVNSDAHVATSALLPVTVQGGFLYGTSELGDSNTNPTLITSAATINFQPTVLSVSSVYLGPEHETATGPTNFQTLEVFGDVATGKVVTELTLVDTLPNGAIASAVTLNDGNGHSWSYSVNAATGKLAALTAGGPAIVNSDQGQTAPWVYYNAAANRIEADFGTITGNAAAIGAHTGPSIATTYSVSQYQTLGYAEQVPSVTTNDLTVTDMLPFGGVAQTFTLSSDNGTFVYAYDATQSGNATHGVSLVSQSAGSTAPAILTGPGTAGSDWVYYDAANGKIVSDFGTIAAGHVASIYAQWQGGQYQLPGIVSQTVGAGQMVQGLTLVDQLNGGAVANSVTLNVGSASYVYDVSGSGVLSFDAAKSSTSVGAPGVVGSAGALLTGTGVYYDAANYRIEANFGTIAGGAAGQTVSINSSFSGGLVLDGSAPQNFPAGNAASAAAGYSSAAYGVGSASSTLPPAAGAANVPGQDVVTDKVIALQKSVANSDGLQPGGHLNWTLNGEVSNYADIQNLVVTDTLGDGQHFTGTPTLVAISNGQTVYSAAFQTADYSVVRDPSTGISTIQFKISQQLIDAGKAADLNGGAAPNDATATPAAATFQIKFVSQIDTALPKLGAHLRLNFLEFSDMGVEIAAPFLYAARTGYPNLYKQWSAVSLRDCFGAQEDSPGSNLRITVRPGSQPLDRPSLVEIVFSTANWRNELSLLARINVDELLRRPGATAPAYVLKLSIQNRTSSQPIPEPRLVPATPR